MDEAAKKTALRMIPYGLFVLGVGEGEQSTLSTVNWVTQTSFKPPLVVVGVKAEGYTWELLQKHQKFAMSVLESGQKDLAFAFFAHVDPKNGKFGIHAYRTHTTGAPVLNAAPSWWECEVRQIIGGGDHAIVVAEVVEAGVVREGNVLTLKECGVNYGG